MTDWRRIVWTFVAVLWAAAASAQNVTLEEIRAPGIEVKAAIVPPGSARVDVLTAESLGGGNRAGGLFLLEFAKASGAPIVLSGGYLAEFSPVHALGLVKVAGRTVNKPHFSWLTTGMFCTRGMQWLLVAAQSDVWREYPNCLQAGPLIIEGGASRYAGGVAVAESEMRLARSEQPQPFVCIRRDGALVLGIAERGSMMLLSQLLVDQVGCLTAMRLSGSVTAGMWSAERGLVGFNKVSLHNAIGVFPVR